MLRDGCLCYYGNLIVTVVSLLYCILVYFDKYSQQKKVNSIQLSTAAWQKKKKIAHLT